MKTISVIRLENFGRLRKELSDPVGPQLAVSVGLSTVYVWQLLKGKRTVIDDKAARKIERKAGKPPGWMDTDHDAAWPFPEISRERFEALLPNQRIEIQGVVRERIERFEAERPQNSGKPAPTLVSNAHDVASPIAGVRSTDDEVRAARKKKGGKGDDHEDRRTP